MAPAATGNGVSHSNGNIAPMCNTSTSLWSHLEQMEDDGIMQLMRAVAADNSLRKLDLGVGSYRTEEGKPYVLETVKEAERRLLADPALYKEYPGRAGSANFCQLAAELAFGADSLVIRERRNVTFQTIAGTGGIRVGTDLIVRHLPIKVVYVPQQTWASHVPIFEAAGLEVRRYRYFQPSTGSLDFQGLLENLQGAEEGAAVVFHACAHNPTGVDPTPDQWQSILGIVLGRSLLPFFDLAYQGFASGDPDKDAYALRLFADAGVEMFVAQTFSKIMGLYSERAGALTVIVSDPAAQPALRSQLADLVRCVYSMPPQHGARIAALILGDPQLREQWKVELAGMASRISSLRHKVVEELAAVGAPGDWSHITNQTGMFSYTGLTPPQVENMIKKWHVYMTRDGRISVPGLNLKTCRYFAEAVADSVTNF